jgi:Mg-chelatase subunit ChlI
MVIKYLKNQKKFCNSEGTIVLSMLKLIRKHIVGRLQLVFLDDHGKNGMGNWWSRAFCTMLPQKRLINDCQISQQPNEIFHNSERTVVLSMLKLIGKHIKFIKIGHL